MRPHLVVALHSGVTTPRVPSWLDILNDKRGVAERLHPRIDALLRAARLPVWTTAEYPMRGTHWDHDEVASGLNRVYRLILQRGKAFPDDLVRDISLLPMVRRARVGRVVTSSLPQGQSTSRAGRGAMGWWAEAIGLERAHASSTGNPDITVAVLDTGQSLKHPETREATLRGMDFVDIIDGASDFIGDVTDSDTLPEDEVGHGSHVAGIIAARGLRMPRGMAPGCRLLPVRVLAAMERDGQRVGAGLVDNINTGVKWAVDQGVQVLNMSLGVRHEGGGLPHSEVIDYARRKGATVVAAS